MELIWAKFVSICCDGVVQCTHIYIYVSYSSHTRTEQNMDGAPWFSKHEALTKRHGGWTFRMPCLVSTETVSKHCWFIQLSYINKISNEEIARRQNPMERGSRLPSKFSDHGKQIQTVTLILQPSSTWFNMSQPKTQPWRTMFHRAKGPRGNFAFCFRLFRHP